jgi:putative addiction module killer protein
MTEWLVKYWDEGKSKGSIEKWIDGLTKEQFKSISRILKLLGRVGNELRFPHSKPLGEGLFELREQQYGYRIYYGFHGKRVIVLLAAGDKKSQTRDIKIARERFAQVIRRNA